MNGSSDIVTQHLPIDLQGTTVRSVGLLLLPRRARALCTLAHGAGAGMQHPFLEAVARRLAFLGIASLRFQFPYMEEGRRRPDPPHLLEATVRAAVQVAREHAGELPLLAGGKSLGGRMTSSAAAEQPLPGVKGLFFLGFPLHPAGKVGDERAKHLASVDVPMLFLQGTRDALAHVDLITTVCERLGSRATLRLIEGADHSFKVLKRSGRSGEEVIAELAEAVSSWSRKLG